MKRQLRTVDLLRGLRSGTKLGMENFMQLPRTQFIPALLTLVCFASFGSSAAAPYEVHFKSGTVLPAGNEYRLPSSPVLAANGLEVHVLLQLENYLRPGDRERLERNGVRLLSYLPDRAYAAVVSRDLDLAGLALLGVRHMSPFESSMKVHPRIISGAFGPWSEYTMNRRVFAAEIMPDVSLDEARTLLESYGCEVGEAVNAAHTLMIAWDPARISEIAAADFVLWIDEAPPPLTPVNDIVRQRLHVNEVQAAPYNLSGQGVTILVYDGGMIDSTHADFGDRVTWNEIAAVGDHPTHVAGTVGGSGQNSGGTYRGMAPQATIISGQYDACIPYCLYESPNDFEEDYTRARVTFQIELTTNSIGANIDPNQYNCDWFGDYETTSRLLDNMTRDLAGSPCVFFFAAGNERGGSWCNNSSYRCMSVPAGAKNIITCGATTSTDQSASFSSWGPTDDGRIKPEVSATGVNVTSTLPGGGYGDMSGTSMATPATSGTACLIFQAWHQMFPGAADPLPETMKAILINSTTDIGPAGPDYQTGFGLVNALTAVQNLQAGGVLESALEIGETFSHSFTVPAGTPVLDVSLAWSDVAAAGNVIPTLVNDLDLVLENPSGGRHNPWILNPANPGSPATTGTDTINVCERVHVVNPAAGTWVLHVTGQLNGSSSQTFGLSANVALVTAWAGVTGQVTNSANSQPLLGRVSVVGGSQGDNTNAQGQYAITLPGNATYNLQAVAFGFVPQLAQVTLGSTIVVQNFALNVAQNGNVNGTVRNQYGAPLPGAVVTFTFPNATIPAETTNTNGVYAAVLPGANVYAVNADFYGADVSTSVAVPENGTVTLDLAINDMRFDPAGPDGYGYRAYEAGDPGASASYSWLEISPQAGGPGTAIPSSGGNDWVATITTPFPIRFYGQQRTSLRVSADGWVGIGAGDNGTQPWTNVQIPTSATPNGMICVFWDDLYPYHPQQGGDLSYYHDQANGRFIIEYRNVPHFNPVTNHVTAQLVFWDIATRPTQTGDNEFQIQYQAVDYYGPGGQVDADATIGIENFAGTDGIQYAYNAIFNSRCFELGAGYALRFTTGSVAGYGTMQGQLTMIPVPPNITDALIAFGPYVVHPQANGSFAVDSVVANTYDVTVSFTGYETGRADDIVVSADSTTTVNFTLYRLDPARNLNGTYDPVQRQIHLTWNWPAWHDALNANGARDRSTLDALTGYEVWLSGTGRLSTVQDTFYTYVVTASRSFNFWVRAMYDGGTADTSNHFRITVDLAAQDLRRAAPQEFFLSQNFPNPFNPNTSIEYGLAQSGHVKLEVFDVTGRVVNVLVDAIQNAGVYRATFDASELGSGIYYCRLRAGSYEGVTKMLFIR